MMDFKSEFAELVLREFAFLAEYGFRVAGTEQTIVRYVSVQYELNIYFGSRTKEIGIEFGPLVPTPAGHASLAPMVAVTNETIAWNLPPQIPIGSRADMIQRVHSLATDFQRLVPAQVLSRDSFWGEVVAQSRKRWDATHRTMTEQDLLARFDAMWRERDFVSLAILFGPLREKLSVEQRENLEIAESIFSQGR